MKCSTCASSPSSPPPSSAATWRTLSRAKQAVKPVRKRTRTKTGKRKQGFTSGLAHYITFSWLYCTVLRLLLVRSLGHIHICAVVAAETKEEGKEGIESEASEEEIQVEDIT